MECIMTTGCARQPTPNTKMSVERNTNGKKDSGRWPPERDEKLTRRGVYLLIRYFGARDYNNLILVEEHSSKGSMWRRRGGCLLNMIQKQRMHG